MKRREFITAIGVAAAWPLVEPAQQAKAIGLEVSSVLLGRAAEVIE